MKAYLGISAYYHDSAAAIVVDGKVVAAAQEERFNRLKHTALFPTSAVRYCMEKSGLSFEDLEAVVFYDKPLLTFERLLETYRWNSPRGVVSFVLAMPVWLREKLFLKKRLRKGLRSSGMKKKFSPRLLFTEHHLSHAASAYFGSGYEDSAILTIDGVGEWATATISRAKGGEIEVLKEMHFPHSLGLLYSSFTYFLGFKVNSGEYKLMGLAPYGDPDSLNTHRFVDLIKSKLVNCYEDGSIWLDRSYFRYMTGSRMIRERKWETLFELKRRRAGDRLLQIHCDLALAIQLVTEEVVLKMVAEAKRLTGSDHLCMAGGVALNAISNYKLSFSKLFKELWIQPASGDAGGALGAAWAAFHLESKEKFSSDEMTDVFLGPEFSDESIQESLDKLQLNYRYLDQDTLLGESTQLLQQGAIIGWFQGRMEFGPRALGNRSILADPSFEGIQGRLNELVKKRESFRPFAPIVRKEKAADYFELTDSPFMLHIAPLKQQWREALSEGYMKLEPQDRLAVKRSRFQAITHVDFSARLQTVSVQSNPLLYRLLESFEAVSDHPILLNTSFNQRGEPIVCHPEDAIKSFLRTGIDYLVIGSFILDQREQSHIDPIIFEGSFQAD